MNVFLSKSTAVNYYVLSLTEWWWDSRESSGSDKNCMTEEDLEVLIPLTIISHAIIGLRLNGVLDEKNPAEDS